MQTTSRFSKQINLFVTVTLPSNFSNSPKEESLEDANQDWEQLLMKSVNTKQKPSEMKTQHSVIRIELFDEI